MCLCLICGLHIFIFLFLFFSDLELFGFLRRRHCFWNKEFNLTAGKFLHSKPFISLFSSPLSLFVPMNKLDFSSPIVPALSRGTRLRNISLLTANTHTHSLQSYLFHSRICSCSLIDSFFLWYFVWLGMRLLAEETFLKAFFPSPFFFITSVENTHSYNQSILYIFSFFCEFFLCFWWTNLYAFLLKCAQTRFHSFELIFGSVRWFDVDSFCAGWKDKYTSDMQNSSFSSLFFLIYSLFIFSSGSFLQ